MALKVSVLHTAYCLLPLGWWEGLRFSSLHNEQFQEFFKKEKNIRFCDQIT
jgi:hypothetical protein